MADHFKRYVGVIVGVLLAIIAWVERSDDPPVMASDTGVLPIIGQQYLGTIDPDREVLDLPDAFRVLLPTKRAELEAHPFGEGFDADGNPIDELPPEFIAPPDPGFVLELKSVVAFSNGGGQAVINNTTVKVGSIIPGTDRENPPVLAALMGTSALIIFEGEHLLMDVDRIPQLRVGADEVDGIGRAPARTSVRTP